MFKIRQKRVARYVAALLLLSLYVLPTVCLAKTPKAVTPPTKTILVFPFEDTTKWAGEPLSSNVQLKIQTGLSSTGGFRAFAFSESLPSVQRAVLENSLKKDDLKGPFGVEKSQVDSALKIGREMAADIILIGSIDDAKFDAVKHNAQITVTTMLVDVRTGESKTVAVSGMSPADAVANTESDLVFAAGNDTVTKLVNVVAPDQVAMPIQTVQVKKKSSSKIVLWGLLLGLTVGLLSTHNNSGSGDSGTDNPPSPP